MEKLKVKFGESRSRKPLYADEGGNHVGYIQQGPRVLLFGVGEERNA